MATLLNAIDLIATAWSAIAGFLWLIYLIAIFSTFTETLRGRPVSRRVFNVPALLNVAIYVGGWLWVAGFLTDAGQSWPANVLLAGLTMIVLAGLHWFAFTLTIPDAKTRIP